MALTYDQKLLIKEWVAAGKSNREIIRLAAEQDPPFTVKGANITKSYRKTVARQVEQIQEKQEEDALRAGLAEKEARIRMLDETARYLFDLVRRAPLMQVPGTVNSMRKR